MKVSTWKCLISVFVVMILCQAAVAVEQFDLLPCTEGDSGGMLYCTEYDSVGEISYLHDNITRRMTVKLPLLVLTQLWLNQGEIVIVTPSGDVINNGQELVRSDDRDRWTIVFKYEHVNSDVGKLHLVLHMKEVEYRDEQYLHMEIRTADNIFVTRGKIWFPVAVRSTDTSTDHEGEAEDTSAILLARIETLQNKTEFLLEEKIAAENASIHYQTKYYQCLEVKDDLIMLKGTAKFEVEGKGQGNQHVTIATLFFVILLVFIVMTLVVIILKGFNLFIKPDFTLDNPTKVSDSVESPQKFHAYKISLRQPFKNAPLTHVSLAQVHVPEIRV